MNIRDLYQKPLIRFGIIFAGGIFLIVILLIINQKTGILPFNQVSVEKTLTRADEQYAQGYYQNALDLYQSALSQDPENTKAYLKMAEIYALKGRKAEALSLLDQGLAKVKDKSDLYFTAGKLSLELDNPEKSREYLIHADLKEPETHLLIGRAYLKQDNLTNAQPEFETVTSLRPETPAGHYYLSLTLALSNLDRAKTEASQAAAKNWELSAASETWAQTVKETTTAKNNLYATVLICHGILTAGFPQVVLTPLQQVLQADPKYRDAFLILGAAEFDLNKETEALSHLNAASALDPAYAETSLLLGKLYAFQGNSAAADYFKKATELEPFNSLYLQELALYYEKQKMFAEAAVTWKQLIKNEKTDTEEKIDAQIKLGFLEADELEQVNEAEVIVSALQKTLTNDPDKPPTEAQQKQIMDLTWWVQHLKGNNTEALAGFQGLVATYPKEALIWYHKGKVEEALGQKKEARVSFDRATDLDLTGEVVALL